MSIPFVSAKMGVGCSWKVISLLMRKVDRVDTAITEEELYFLEEEEDIIGKNLIEAVVFTYIVSMDTPANINNFYRPFSADFLLKGSTR